MAVTRRSGRATRARHAYSVRSLILSVKRKVRPLPVPVGCGSVTLNDCLRSRVLTALRHALAILLLPTMVTIVVPTWILRTFAAVDSRWPPDAWAWLPRTLGGLTTIAGLSLLAWCISLFARVGKGTLAPWDPTSNLVAVGPYRYTRNPMITGVATILTGEALATGSWRLALWAGIFVVFNHAYFLLDRGAGSSRAASASRTSTTNRRCPGGFRASAPARLALRATVDQRRRLNTSTPMATRPMPNHSRATGRSPRNATANTATRTTLSLSTGATFAASPILRARK